ncbi:MAG: serine/threonine protein kinase, partial [Nannocystaceae bacterium]|nr:serine/threonine protein kinase [Nannocystaceae bacterium]
MAALDAPASTQSELSESAIGERLGRFRVLERLGKGGMGVVYSAYDPQLDRKIAVKLLRPDVQDGMGSEAATARLLREAQAMAKISDPNVIVVHEVGVLKGRVFLAMEFVDGGTLGSWMAKRPSWREVLEVFLKAGSGLVAAHRGGLVHRDFKPENVLMGTDGRVRVVDFGLARSLFDEEVEEHNTRPIGEEPELDSFNTPLTRTGAIMGTPAYMSPEQHLGRPATARADQFSFCVAMWEALFGSRPFRGTSLAELTGNVLGG